MFFVLWISMLNGGGVNPKFYQKTVLSLAFTMVYLISFAQEYKPQYIINQNTYLQNNFMVFDSTGWLRTIDGIDVNFNAFNAERNGIFGLNADNNFTLTRSDTDNLPFLAPEKRLVHHRYQQTYKGVMVEYAEMLIHHKDNKIRYINSKIAESLNLNVQPSLTEAAALTAATNHLGASNLYAWLDSAYVAAIREDTGDSTATGIPKGELIIAKIKADNNYAADQFALAWKFNIKSLQPDFNKAIYINAQNGAFIKQIELKIAGHADLHFNYGNNMYIDTKWRGGIWNNYVLRGNDANAPKVWTKKASYDSFMFLNAFGKSNKNETIDGDDIWGTDKKNATTAHWTVTQAWNYFKTTFNQDGFDDQGTEVKIFYDVNDLNAYYDPIDENGYLLGFGTNNGITMASKDIAGHEFTHGIINKHTGLNYEYESGALNESFADIFGNEVERYTNGGVHTNWDIGEDIYFLRKMNNPSNSIIIQCSGQSQPSYYGGPRWYTGICDNGGVHINSGVGNYWFYLLSMGSVGAPDGTYNNIAVSGIGQDKARNITFYNIVSHITSNSHYKDARIGSLLAAEVLYGRCSNEYKQVMNAWAAVNVGLPYSPLSIDGPRTIFRNGNTVLGLPIRYKAKGDIPGLIHNNKIVAYTWNYNGPWTMSQGNTPGTSHIFSIDAFNNQFPTPVSIQANSGCSSTAIGVKIINLLDIQYTGNQNQVNLFPNPASESISITIDFPNAQLNPATNQLYPIQVTIINMQGQPEMQLNYPEGLPDEISIANLAAGTYVVYVQQGDQGQYIKFIKE